MTQFLQVAVQLGAVRFQILRGPADTHRSFRAAGAKRPGAIERRAEQRHTPGFTGVTRQKWVG